MKTKIKNRLKELLNEKERIMQQIDETKRKIEKNEEAIMYFKLKMSKAEIQIAALLE